ncbi:MAG: hypothetical protein M3Z37_11480, partial [Candidatus Eremiobacteraeota bacterium]|nr:hypothetical protein [Candidatus Eremiobacteraeota bacterium]
MPEFEDPSGSPGVESPTPAPAPNPHPAARPPRKRIWIPLVVLLLIALVASFGFYAKTRGYNALAPFLPSPDLTQVFGKNNLRVLVMG